MDLMVSLFRGGNQLDWFLTCFLPRTRVLGLGFLGYLPHLNEHQVIICEGLKVRTLPNVGYFTNVWNPPISRFLQNESHLSLPRQCYRSVLSKKHWLNPLNLFNCLVLELQTGTHLQVGL